MSDSSHICSGWIYALAVLGLVVLLQIAYSLVCIIWGRFRWAKKNFVERYGKWAVVTGCTNGIGKAYVHELAKAGMDIVLISRNIDKLNAVATDLEEKYGVQTHIIQADFTEGRSIYRHIERGLEGMEIGMLVNNVGITAGVPNWFENMTDDNIWDGINVNAASVPAMTKIVLPSMLKRQRGCIVNVGSLAANTPLSVGAVYCGTKAFVSNFSQSLSLDVASKGIEVQTLLPSFVATDMLDYSDTVGRPSIISPSASQYVKEAVSSIGFSKMTSGYWAHNLMKFFLENTLFRWITCYISDNVWRKLLLEKQEKLKSTE